MDRQVLLRIAEAGCYLEWDHFSSWSSVLSA